VHAFTSFMQPPSPKPLGVCRNTCLTSAVTRLTLAAVSCRVGSELKACMKSHMLLSSFIQAVSLFRAWLTPPFGVSFLNRVLRRASPAFMAVALISCHLLAGSRSALACPFQDLFTRALFRSVTRPSSSGCITWRIRIHKSGLQSSSSDLIWVQTLFCGVNIGYPQTARYCEVPEGSLNDASAHQRIIPDPGPASLFRAKKRSFEWDGTQRAILEDDRGESCGRELGSGRILYPNEATHSPLAS